MPAQTLFVNGLPASASNERLAEIFSEVGPVKQCFVVRQKDAEKCRGFGYVTYSMTEDSERAMKEIKEYDGHRISVCVAKKKLQEQRKTAPKEPEAAPKKNKDSFTGSRKNKLKSRLIIRNLSFQCSEDDLKNVCSKFGKVLEVNIPLKPDGKMRGFAFVLFKNMCGAGKALNALNLKEIKGRQVAVDWAVPKDRFLATQSSSRTGNKTPVEETPKQSDSDSEDEDEEKTPAAPQKKKVTSKPAVQQVEESQSDDEDSEEQDSEEEDEDEEEDGSQEGEDDDQSGIDSNDDDEIGSDDEEEEEEDDEEDESGQKKATRKPLPSDVKEGRTVFIRNLSFDTEEEGLKEVLQKYGDLNYIKIVMQPETDHSKGCAFAQFKTKEAADECIAASQDESESGGIRVDGRKLFIVLAVSKEDAAKLKVDKVKVETGIRNLYLAREGLIRAGTKAAEGVSEADMIKRARFEDLKRTKLRDINVYVSKTRLCVHNLPKSVDNKRLRAVCLEAVKEKKGVRIVECRVMYDKKPVKNQVMGQSLGYGFVQFQEHEHALSTLRHLNNNPNIFGPHKRPIAEFSLEDSRKLKIKEMRKQKNEEVLNNRHFKKGERQSQTTGEGKGLKKGGNKTQSSSGQHEKEKAAPHNQKRDGRYSGFMTNPEVEHVDLEDGKKRRKVLTFPSHRGPKIRMRDKGKQKAPPAKQAKPGLRRKDLQRQQMEKPTQPRNQKGQVAKKRVKTRDGDRFDSLVEQYKKKLLSSSDKNTTMKRNKWFDS